MDDITPGIMEVLEKSFLMSLGVQDEGGVWVSDVLCLNDDAMNVYWLSDPDTRHSKAIATNPRVAGTITVSGMNRGENSLGIQFEGMAEKIDGPRFDLAQKFMAKLGAPSPKETDDVTKGDSWYKLTPSRIDYINRDKFGFEKKTIQL